MQSRQSSSKMTMIPMEVAERIDWDMFERSTKLLIINRRIWLLKHVSGFAPTAPKIVDRKEWDNDLCPQCERCREITEHMLECTHQDAMKNKMKSIIMLQNWMKGVETAPGIIECIAHALTAAAECSFEEMTRDQLDEQQLNNLITDVAIVQDTIGWYDFTRGRIAV